MTGPLTAKLEKCEQPMYRSQHLPDMTLPQCRGQKQTKFQTYPAGRTRLLTRQCCNSAAYSCLREGVLPTKKRTGLEQSCAWKWCLPAILSAHKEHQSGLKVHYGIIQHAEWLLVIFFFANAFTQFMACFLFFFFSSIHIFTGCK